MALCVKQKASPERRLNTTCYVKTLADVKQAVLAKKGARRIAIGLFIVDPMLAIDPIAKLVRARLKHD